MIRLHNHLSLLLFAFCLIVSSQTFSQGSDSTLDSLIQILESTGPDTTRANTLLAIGKQLKQEAELDSALKYCSEAIRLSGRLGYQSGLAEAYATRGKIRIELGNYPEAMDDYQSAHKYYRNLGDKKNVANVYNMIANAYHIQGDLPNALKNQYSALNIRESLGDEEGMAWSYNNIGSIYRVQGELESALKNYVTALKILEKFGDLKTIAIAHSNIGYVYTLQGKHTEALDKFITSLKIRQQAGDVKEIIASYFNIGDTFSDLYEKDSTTKEVIVDFDDYHNRIIPRDKWLETGMHIFLETHALNLESGNKYYSIFSLSGMGRINFLKKNYSESIKLYSQAYEVAEEMKAVELQQEIAKYLSDNYNNLNDFKNGLKWYMQFTAHKDTLFNALKSEDLTRTQMKYEFDKKELQTKSIQERKDALAKAELVKQKKMRNIFVGGFALVLVFAGIFFYQRNDIRKEKIRSDNLLLNILPAEIANELKQTGASKTKSFNEVTVMFADFVDFTIISEKLSPEALVAEINTCFSAFDQILQKYKVEKIKTIGDAYMCAGGLPVSYPGHADQVVKASLEIREFIRQHGKEKVSLNEIPFDIRIGIHTGPVVAGIVGVKKYAYDIWGDTVNIAARMEQNSDPGKINISSKTYDLVKDKYQCTYRGKIEAKHKGEIDMYFLEA